MAVNKKDTLGSVTMMFAKLIIITGDIQCVKIDLDMLCKEGEIIQ